MYKLYTPEYLINLRNGMLSPYVNPSSYVGNMFESTPIAMRTEGATCGILSGGGGGIYHGFDGNRAGYDLSAYQNTYLPQMSGNHAMQRLDPYSLTGGGSGWGARVLQFKKRAGGTHRQTLKAPPKNRRRCGNHSKRHIYKRTKRTKRTNVNK